MILTLTGPSCAGKSTLEKMLKAKGFENAISTTTRAPRDGEFDGESYFFISESEFKRLEVQGAFVETVEFNGNYYGLSVKEIERLIALGKPIVVVCEPGGQKQIDAYCRKRSLSLYSVFVDNPTSVIAERFLRRFAHEMDYVDVVKNRTLPTFASRLESMMTTERGWIVEAYSSPLNGPYDLVLTTFDENNDEAIVNALAGAAA